MSTKELASAFRAHSEEDGKNFAMVQKEIRDSEDRLEAKIAKKLDKAVFTMFLTIALPVFSALTWYMIYQIDKTRDEMRTSLSSISRDITETTQKLVETSTNVSWIKSVFEKYDIIVK